jgi:hypothetical protein
MAQAVGNFKGYMVAELEQLIMWELGQVAGTTASYARFPKWLIRQKMTERQNLFAFLSHCLTKYALIAVKEDYRTYKLPSKAMESGIVSAKYFYDDEEYTDLKIVDRAYLDDHEAGWLTEDGGDPQYIFPDLTYGNIATIGLHPKPDESATEYDGTDDTGIYIGTTAPGAGANHSGTTTSAGAGTTLNDTGTTFTKLGIVAGMYALNVTDGSYARITVVAANALTTASLTGGTDDTWASGDSYLILAGEYATLTFPDEIEKYAFGYKIGALSNITIPAGNIYVEYIPYPLAFAHDYTAADASQGYDYQYPEIPKLYHMALVWGVVSDLLGTFHEKSKEFQRAEYYEKKFEGLVTAARSHKESTPFKRKPVQIFPKMRR